MKVVAGEVGLCGIAVGAVAAAASYSASNAGTSNFSTADLITDTLVGGVTGGVATKALGAAANSRALAKPVSLGGERMARVHFDRQVHPFKGIGNRSHWQVNVWKKGVKDKPHAIRIPVLRSF